VKWKQAKIKYNLIKINSNKIIPIALINPKIILKKHKLEILIIFQIYLEIIKKILISLIIAMKDKIIITMQNNYKIWKTYWTLTTK
jgi:hypothetical protein